MSYIALYRKYRPNKFSDVIGQDIIVKILQNSIISNNISHAYLFNGPRGTGKTSLAKIFAKAVNCLNPNNGEPCEKCDICKILKNNETDIIEIDAASNNGVEEIREIRNNVKLMPSVGKYKIYIIDEVHMLSIGAFNALLKTLEEPPAHVIFILATTEINKIPLTVLSRCQRFDFSKIPIEILTDRLELICKKENKKIQKDILKLISQLSDGSCRDAISLLDQIISLNTSEITSEQVYDLQGAIPEESVFGLLESMYMNDFKKGFDIINSLVEKGKNLNYVVEKLLILLRNISISKVIEGYFNKQEQQKYKNTNLDISQIKLISEILTELSTKLNKSTDQQSLFEIYYIYISDLLNKKEEIVPKNEKVLTKKINDNKNLSQSVTISAKNKEIRINNALALANKIEKNNILNNYEKINDYLSNKKYNHIAALLLEAKIEVASEKYLLFSYKKTNYIPMFDSNIKEIEEFLNFIYGKKYLVVCIKEDEWKKIKIKYIDDLKKHKKYDILEEQKEKKIETKTVKEKAQEIFGEDIINCEEGE